jgi:hypothetical protein
MHNLHNYIIYGAYLLRLSSPWPGATGWRGRGASGSTGGALARHHLEELSGKPTIHGHKDQTSSTYRIRPNP